MIPYYATPDGKVTLLHGHVLDVLREMPFESVNCVVTSPPYWSLRKYDCEPVVWGGDSGCEHQWGADIPGDPRGGSGPNGKEMYAGDGKSPYARQEPRGNVCRLCGAWLGQYGLEPTPELYVEHTMMWLREVRRVLRKDGTLWLNLGDGYASGSSGHAGESQLDGGEPTGSRSLGRVKPPGNGLKAKDAILMPFRVALAAQADGWWVRSVIIWHKNNPMPESVKDRPTDAHEYIIRLEKDKPPLDERDIIWLAASLDSDGCIRVGKFGKRYAGQVIFSGKDERLVQHFAALAGVGHVSSRPHERGGRQWMWRASDATAAWLLRQVEPYLVSKRAQAHIALTLEERKGPMGKKVDDEEWAKRDRLFQMSKALNSGKGGSDLPIAALPEEDYQYIFLLTKSKTYWYDADAVRERAIGGNDHDLTGQGYAAPGQTPQAGNRAASHKGSYFDRGKTAEHQLGRASSEPRHDSPNGRNCRSVWTFPTRGFPDAHFAVFPKELPERCILAGCPESVCPKCGKARVRVTEILSRKEHPAREHRNVRNKADFDGEGYARRDSTLGLVPDKTVESWSDCGCGAGFGGGVVLDPFVGSGTTCEVAYHLGRTAIGIDASAKYLDMAIERVKQGALL